MHKLRDNSYLIIFFSLLIFVIILSSCSMNEIPHYIPPTIEMSTAIPTSTLVQPSKTVSLDRPDTVRETLHAEATEKARLATATPGPFSTQVSSFSPTPIPTALGQNPNQGPVPEGANFRLGKGEPEDIDISPDGRFIVLGSWLGIFLYQVDSHEQIWSYITNDPVWGIAYSPDGRYIGAATGKNILLLNAATGQRIRSSKVVAESEEDFNFACGVAFSPDSKNLAGVAGYGNVVLWNVSSGNKIRSFTSTGSSYSCRIKYSNDGKTLATLINSELELWDPKTGKLQQSIHGEFVPSMGYETFIDFSLSPDGKTVVTGNGAYWDLQSGEVVFEVEGADFAVLSYSPSGEKLALGVTDKLSLRNAETGEELWSVPYDRMNSAVDLQFFPDGEILAVAFPSESIVFLDVESGDRKDVIEGHFGTIGLAFSNDSQLIVSLDWAEIVRVWEADSGWLTHLFVDAQLAVNGTITDVKNWKNLLPGVRFELVGEREIHSPDGKIKAVGKDSGVIQIRDVDTDEIIKELNIPDDYNPVRYMAFSADSSIFAAFDSANDVLWFWDVVTGKPIKQLENAGYGVAFSPDGRLLATSAFDGSILVWSLPRFIYGPSPSGCMLTKGQSIQVDDSARLWSEPDVTKGSILSELVLNQTVYVIDGPELGPILSDGSLSDWFWGISLSVDGESSGWLWQGKIIECQ